MNPAQVSATAPLRRAGMADIAAVNAFQHAAYARKQLRAGNTEAARRQQLRE